MQVGDLTGGYHRCVSTLDAARVGDIAARVLGTDPAESSVLAPRVAALPALMRLLACAPTTVIGRAPLAPVERSAK
ncbi:hypothetical protein [Mycolicibacterium psychrotolerans]|uniref:Uncharacterized protein n=1 Tax=Mycolicibacterium psychrotolerans TaxID=216929 RepID=A0A7I7M608_9MYCO|nr:hypothetical protein [Mycolicibacterium psychrotolerans]BBX67628.1 hypothetical protein MPSYJ_10890 [Mycolicibacterium psychrotolerans]